MSKSCSKQIRLGVERRTSELIQSLSATLQKIEEKFTSPEDQRRIAEIKRILLLRIADFEFVGAVVEKGNSEDAEHQVAVHPSVIEDDPEAA